MSGFDVLVLGLGGMGTSAAFHLASRGVRVLGLDALGLAHDRGSSHGESRLIRKAYFESPAYVPLLERAYTLWDELAAATGTSLLQRTGLILVGDRGERAATERARAVAAAHAIHVEELDAAETRKRFPSLVVADDASALWEPGAGWLAVERCVEAHAQAAERAGAVLQWDEPVRSVVEDGGAVRVVTTKATYEAKVVVVTAGAWTNRLLGSFGLPLVVHRVVQSWFDAPPAFDARSGMPCFAYDGRDGFFYGFPRGPRGEIKVAEHAARREVDPDTVDRAIHGEDTVRTATFVGRALRDVAPRATRSKVCLYTMTPDEHFIVDRHEGIVFAAGFSGHGFKFASVIGEALAELALEGRTKLDLAFLRRRDR
jgi:monomeric sarcosine oxidase